MILSEDCKKCKYGITIKCENGDEYIACDMQRCQQEKMKKGKDLSKLKFLIHHVYGLTSEKEVQIEELLKELNKSKGDEKND